MRERQSGRNDALQRMSFGRGAHDSRARAASKGLEAAPSTLSRGLQGHMARSCGVRPQGAAASIRVAAPLLALDGQKTSQCVRGVESACAPEAS
jgi:hypothetical protein